MTLAEKELKDGAGIPCYSGNMTLDTILPGGETNRVKSLDKASSHE